MYLNFSNFWDELGWEGQALVKTWGQVSDGGLAKFVSDGGPPRKKPWTH